MTPAKEWSWAGLNCSVGRLSRQCAEDSAYHSKLIYHQMSHGLYPRRER
jgi:hypothetical protein